MVEIPHITKVVYRELIEHFGEPDAAITYDESTANGPHPLALDLVMVMVWRPTPELDLTTFGTVGMSSRELPGESFRLELLFTVRGLLEESLERKVTQFLANMAGYPWDHGHTLDWWHTLRNPGPIPAFPGCCAILFHPRWVPEGWDTIEHGDDVVHLLNVIPLTLREREIAARAKELNAYWEAHGTDVFSDRSV